QDGGADKISIAALSGEAADEQKSSWAKVSGKPTTFDPSAHKASHQDGGADKISIAALSGEAADEQKSSWAKVSGKPTTFLHSTAVLADHKLIRGDGGSRNVQDCGILVSDNGEMTNPSQPSFFAKINTQQTDVTGDNTTFNLTGAFWTSFFDQNNDFSDGTFTAPVTGRYQFNINYALSHVAAAHNSCYFRIVTSNGTYYLHCYNNGAYCDVSGYTYHGCSILLDMDANDTAYIAIQIKGGAKVIDIGQNQTLFSGALIC
ncbi:unnamed protein product, partial [marine sediment metagenome]